MTVRDDPSSGLPPTPRPPAGPGPAAPADVTAVPWWRRVRWRLVRTVVVVVAGLVVAGVVGAQVAVTDPVAALRQADAGWFVVVLLGAVLTFVGATTALVAVSPVRLRPAATAGVQVAGTFVNLLGPAGVGGMALNVRHLYRRGAPVPAAVAAVVAVQATSVLVTVLVLVGAAVASDELPGGVALLPGTVTVVTLAVLAAVVGVVLGVARLRRAVVPRLRAPLAASAGVLRDLGRRPDRLVLALLGASLVTGGFLLALGASLQAYGASLPLISLAVVLFAGTAVGSVFPTPGGVGAVEVAVAGGLVAVGVAPSAALLTAVTYRLVTLWVWVLPGWVLTLLLRRAGQL